MRGCAIRRDYLRVLMWSDSFRPLCTMADALAVLRNSFSDYLMKIDIASIAQMIYQPAVRPVRAIGRCLYGFPSEEDAPVAELVHYRPKGVYCALASTLGHDDQSRDRHIPHHQFPWLRRTPSSLAL